MRVNLITLIGAALIVFGIVAFAYRGIPYIAYRGIPYTTRATVVDVGSLQAGLTSKKTMPMSPLLIGLLLAGGAGLLLLGAAKSS
jgi:hypothetical protein